MKEEAIRDKKLAENAEIKRKKCLKIERRKFGLIPSDKNYYRTDKGREELDKVQSCSAEQLLEEYGDIE